MDKCPKCDNDEVWQVEYSWDSPQHYDGISEWWCNPEVGGCGYRQGRWTGEELHEGEIESVFGQHGVVKLAIQKTIEAE